MKLKTPINENYAATIVTIKNLIPLEKCDNVVHTLIFGNLVVVGKDTKVGDRGIFFPIETRLSDEFLYTNNLYRDNTKNCNINEKGYFEDNGRIRCVKFRGHKSEGMFLPATSILFAAEAVDVAALPEGSTFDEINGVKICEKYIPKITYTPGTPGSKNGNQKIAKKVSRIIDGQFRFHEDTKALGKNIFKVKPDSFISITNKLHGSSFITSKILCKKKIGWFPRLLKTLGVPINDTHYDNIWSSRKVIKNDDLGRNYNHFYGEDIWADVSKELAPYLLDGMTIYGEVVGFTRSGRPIQGGYDYGYDPKGQFNTCYGIYIYRITFTTFGGKVFEFSAKQVQDWCKANMLKAVPEFYYVKAGDWLPVGTASEEEWYGELLTKLLTSFNMEKDCDMCKAKVPAEGFVLRIEGLEYEAYKLKSFRFKERETRELDSGTVDIETQESQGG
jgi:hypothetical protein